VDRPKGDEAEPIRTKDVNLSLAAGDESRDRGDWASTVTFAPDELSAGLTVQVQHRSSHFLVATPQSLILGDDDSCNEGTVQLIAKENTSPITIKALTGLPLKFDIVPGAPSRSGIISLRVHVQGPLTHDLMGKVQVEVKVGLSNPAIESISIPVVVLHHQQSTSKITANGKSSCRKGELS
jgi:hypothetical protein